MWAQLSPTHMAGPLRTHLSDSIVWMSMLLWARMSLSQHPRVMSETSSMLCAHTTQPWGGPDTSSEAALVFSFPSALLKRSIESSF